MSARLTEFLQQQRVELSQAVSDSDALYFVIDTVLQPTAAAQLYGVGEPIESRLLFLGTAFDSLAEYSPLWVKVAAGSEVARLAGALCFSEQAGIVLEASTTEEAAFQHAQRLLLMRSATAGESLARFYDPLFWSALALTASGAQRAALFGPWRQVLTPAEPSDEERWLAWPNTDASAPTQAFAYPLPVSAEALDQHEDLRWYYWLCGHREVAPQPLSGERLPLLIDNLRLLANHDIQDGRHLLRLLPRLDRVPLGQQPNLMAVLNSDVPSYQKVQHLEGMMT